MDFVQRRLVASESATNALAIAPDGRWVATTSFDQKLRIYDSATLEEVNLLHLATSFPNVLSFSRDGSHLMAGGKSIHLFETTAWKKLGSLKGHKEDAKAGDFSPDGKRFYSCSDDGTVRAWDVSTLKEIWRRKDFGIESVVVSPDGETIACGNPGNVILVDPNGKELRNEEWQGARLAFSHSGKELYGSGGDHTDSLSVFDLYKGKERTLPLGAATRSFALSKDGKLVFVGCSSLNGGDNAERVVVLDTGTGKERWKSPPLCRLPKGLVLSPDERSFYVLLNEPDALVAFDKTS